MPSSTSSARQSCFTEAERQQIAAALRAQAALEYLQRTRPAWAMSAEHDFPHDHGQLQAVESDHMIRILIPGNGFGKTTCMGLDADMLLQRDDPFKPHMMPQPDRPTVAIWFCQKYQQWEVIKGELEPTIFTVGWKWHEQKHYYEWPNGSRLYVISSDSDWTSIQGIQIDAVYFDEHPDRKFWIEMQYRRRGVKKTRYMIAATMTLGITWLVIQYIQEWEKWNRDQGRTNAEALQAQDHPKIFCWNEGGIDDNPGMDVEDKEHYESITAASEKERHVRLKGGYADFTGEMVFDLAALKWMKERAQEGVSGRLVFVGDEDDDVADRIRMIHASTGEAIGHRWAGVLDREFFHFHEGMEVERGRITIFEPPLEEEAGNYIIGSDFAAGLVGKDYDACLVGKKTADGQVIQVAEAVGHWGDIFFAEVLYALGVWYYEAFITGERQFGLPTLRRLYDEMGYTFLYRRRLTEKANERISDNLGHHKSVGDTTIPNLRLAIKRKDLILVSAETIQQFIRFQFRPRVKSLTIDEVTESSGLVTGAPDGEFDDLVLGGSYLWHGAREIVHFDRAERPYRPGTYGDVLKVDKVLKGEKTKRSDPYAIKSS